MKHVVFLGVAFAIFAAAYPQTMGRSWSSEMVSGYRLGMIGAIAVLVTYALGRTFLYDLLP